eukprot:6835656-Lingulodinium_polyedra.AAC.1
MVAEIADVTAVMAARGDWTACGGAVTRLVSRSKVGAALFSFAAKHVNTSQWGEEINIKKEVDEYFSGERDVKRFEAMKVVLMKKGAEYQEAGVLGFKRETAVEFMGATFQVPVVDAWSEAELHIFAMVKKHA